MLSVRPHKHKEVTEWANRRGFTVHFTPTYGPLVSQVEIWCNFLKDVIRGGVWKSRQSDHRSDGAIGPALYGARGTPLTIDVHGATIGGMSTMELMECSAR